MGMNCGLTKNSLPFTFDTHGHKLYMCWRMSPSFAVLPPQLCTYVVSIVTLSFSYKKHTTPSSFQQKYIGLHSFIQNKSDSCSRSHTHNNNTAEPNQANDGTRHVPRRAPILLAAVTVAPFAAEARDVADVEGRSLSADAPSSDASAPRPDSSSSPSDAPLGSSSSDV